MAGVSGRTVEVKLRLPVDLHAVVVARAQATGASKSQVIISMIRDGIAAGSGREPATREDVAALRDQMTALTEFQKAQAIALMDGVRNAIEAAPVQALPSGVPEDEHERLMAARDDEIAVLREQLKEMHRGSQTSTQALSERIAEAVGAERERCADEIELLQGLLADERELSHSLGEQVRSMRGELDAERGRMEDELEKQRGEIGFEGYMRGVEDCRKAGLVKRLLGRF